MVSMVFWKTDGAVVMPKGRRVYWKRPRCVFTVTYFWDSSSNGAEGTPAEDQAL